MDYRDRKVRKFPEQKGLLIGPMWWVWFLSLILPIGNHRIILEAYEKQENFLNERASL